MTLRRCVGCDSVFSGPGSTCPLCRGSFSATQIFPDPFKKSLDEKLLGELAASKDEKIIKILEEIRDRLAGVRPVIIVPTTKECETYGRKS